MTARIRGFEAASTDETSWPMPGLNGAVAGFGVEFRDCGLDADVVGVVETAPCALDAATKVGNAVDDELGVCKASMGRVKAPEV